MDTALRPARLLHVVTATIAVLSFPSLTGAASTTMQKRLPAYRDAESLFPKNPQVSLRFGTTDPYGRQEHPRGVAKRVMGIFGEPLGSPHSSSNAGRTVVEVTESADPYGSITSLSRTTTLHDQHGNVLRLVWETDLSLDGVYDYRFVEVFRYNQRGFVVESVGELDSDADGEIDSRRTLSTTAYNLHGNPEEQVEDVRELPAGTIHYRTVFAYVYDLLENPVHGTFVTDFGGDGTVDERSLYDFAWDGRGNLMSTEWVYDYAVDGVLEWRVFSARSYDSHENLVGYVWEFDASADGSVENNSTTILEYNQHDTVIGELWEEDAGADGVAENRNTRSTAEFDARGNPVVQLGETDYGADGVPDGRSTTTLVYNARGELVQSVMEVDASPFGSIEALHTTWYDYGRVSRASGNPLLTAGEEDQRTEPGPGLRAISSNPFRGEIELLYNGSDAPVDLRIFDATGRLVRVLAQQGGNAGARKFVWDGRNESGLAVPSGVYFAQLRAGVREFSTRLMRLR